MICRNCKFSLQGSEKFCPNCGAPLSETPSDVKSEEISAPEPPRIFFTPVKNESTPPTEDFSIFEKEVPVTKRNEEDVKKSNRKKKSGSKAPVALMLLLMLVILTAGLFVAAEHFDVAPAIMQYLQPQTETTAAKDELIYDYDKSKGLIEPDISYSPTGAYVSKNDSLSLRRGPDDSYGMLMTLKSGCQLQILGGTALNDMWIYVYVPFYDCYGWLNSSFITLLTDVGNLPSTTEITEQVTTQSTSQEASETQESTSDENN